MYGGAMASWLVHSSLERAVQVRALAGDTVLHCWARNLALTMPLSTQEYTWVLEVARVRVSRNLSHTHIPFL